MRLRLVYESARLGLRARGIRPGVVTLPADALVPRVAFLDGRRRHTDARLDVPLVVFVHGLGSSVVTWAATLPRVAERAPAVAVDLPGYGRSPLPPGQAHTTIREKVAVLGAFLDAVAPDRPVHLVGQSMGGWTAAWCAALRPDKVARLTLVNPAGVFTPQVFEQRRLFTPRDLRETRVLWERMWHRLPRSFPLFQKDYLRLTRLPEVRGFLDSVAEEDFLNRGGARISCPTLVVWGLSDEFLDFQTVRLLAEVAPDLRVRLMPDCGHVPQREDPPRFLRLLIPWVLGEEPPGPDLSGPSAPAAVPGTFGVRDA